MFKLNKVKLIQQHFLPVVKIEAHTINIIILVLLDFYRKTKNHIIFRLFMLISTIYGSIHCSWFG